MEKFQFKLFYEISLFFLIFPKVSAYDISNLFKIFKIVFINIDTIYYYVLVEFHLSYKSYFNRFLKFIQCFIRKMVIWSII